MIYVNILQLSLLLFVARVSASLYPTKPIADTIYIAGQTVSVEWIDDTNDPHIQDMKVSKIDLYLDDQTFIKTLATEVDASAGVQSIVIPSEIEAKDKYTLRFFCEDDLIVYTAYFNIQTSSEITKEHTEGNSDEVCSEEEDDAVTESDKNSATVEMLNLVTATGSPNDTETGWYQPLLTIVLPNTTFVTTLSPTVKPTATSHSGEDKTKNLGTETSVTSEARSKGLEVSAALALVFLGSWIILY